MLSGRRGRPRWKCPGTVSRSAPETGAAKLFEPLPAPLPDPDRVKAAAA
jgi:acetolactate synthase-1/2/3 large subunit